MIYLNAIISQHYPANTLSSAVRDALGKPLRRAAPLTQLALLGALACLPKDRRSQATALLWQSTSGPRQEVKTLLDEVCSGQAEPMPYDFLATQSSIAAAQIQPFIPGLQSATHCPLDQENTAHWSLLLTLAHNWLNEGRFEQVLCAHLDHWEDHATAHWLALSTQPLENSPVELQMVEKTSANCFTDTPDLPTQLSHWLEQSTQLTQHLALPPTLAVKFIQTST